VKRLDLADPCAFVSSSTAPTSVYSVALRPTRAPAAGISRRRGATKPHRLLSVATQRGKRRVVARGQVSMRVAVSRMPFADARSANHDRFSCAKTAVVVVWTIRVRMGHRQAPTCGTSRISICRRASNRITMRPARAGRDGQPPKRDGVWPAGRRPHGPHYRTSSVQRLPLQAWRTRKLDSLLRLVVEVDSMPAQLACLSISGIGGEGRGKTMGREGGEVMGGGGGGGLDEDAAVDCATANSFLNPPSRGTRPSRQEAAVVRRANRPALRPVSCHRFLPARITTKSQSRARYAEHVRDRRRH